MALPPSQHQHCTDEARVYVIYLYIFLRGLKVSANSCIYIYVTGNDDMISRSIYITMSKQPPSWIRHLGFQVLSKTSESHKKITENYSKAIIRSLKVLKM